MCEFTNSFKEFYSFNGRTDLVLKTSVDQKTGEVTGFVDPTYKLSWYKLKNAVKDCYGEDHITEPVFRVQSWNVATGRLDVDEICWPHYELTNKDRDQLKNLVENDAVIGLNLLKGILVVPKRDKDDKPIVDKDGNYVDPTFIEADHFKWNSVVYRDADGSTKLFTPQGNKRAYTGPNANAENKA